MIYIVLKRKRNCFWILEHSKNVAVVLSTEPEVNKLKLKGGSSSHLYWHSLKFVIFGQDCFPPCVGILFHFSFYFSSIVMLKLSQVNPAVARILEVSDSWDWSVSFESSRICLQSTTWLYCWAYCCCTMSWWQIVKRLWFIEMSGTPFVLEQMVVSTIQVSVRQELQHAWLMVCACVVKIRQILEILL